MRAVEARRRVAAWTHNPLAVLAQPRIFVLAFFYMMISMSIYGITYWLPTVVKGFRGHDDDQRLC